MSGRQPQGGSPQDPTSRFNQTANSQGHGQQFHAQLPSGYPYQSAPSIQGYDPSTQAARTTNDGSVYGKSQSYAQHQYPLGQQPLNPAYGYDGSMSYPQQHHPSQQPPQLQSQPPFQYTNTAQLGSQYMPSQQYQQDYGYAVDKPLPPPPVSAQSGFVQEHHQSDIDGFDYINESRYASTVSTPHGGGANHGGNNGLQYPPVGDGTNMNLGGSRDPANYSNGYDYQGHRNDATQTTHPSMYAATSAHDSALGGGIFVPFAQQRAAQEAALYSDEATSAGPRGTGSQDGRALSRTRLGPDGHGASASPTRHGAGQPSNPIFDPSGASHYIQNTSLSHYQQNAYDPSQGGTHTPSNYSSTSRGRVTAAPLDVHPINAGFGLPLAPEAHQAAFSTGSRMPTDAALANSSAPVKKQKKVEVDDATSGDEVPNAAGSNRAVIPPPVKNACLSCRTKKARCDGQQPICMQCSSKGRECVYVKSRRGGARRRRDKSGQGPPPPAPSALKEFLSRLDGLQAPGGEPPELDSLTMSSGAEGGASGAVDPSIAVRSYAPHDIGGILTSYWEEIHPFQPLLPPIKHKNWVMGNLMQDSPFITAIRAILSLSPHPKDPNPKSLSSRSLRRSQASRLAREASDRVEELLTEVGESDDRSILIECVQALSLLGLYEFAQTGNAVKNRMRMNQAVELAMDIGIHQVDKATFADNKPRAAQATGRFARPAPGKQVEGKDVYKDMQRRTWWVVFAGMLISGLVAGRRPLVSHDDRRIMSDYPSTVVGDDSWGIWIESIGLACQAMDLIMTLDYNLPNPNPTSPAVDPEVSDDDMVGMTPQEKQAAKEKKTLHKRMVQLDRSVLDLLKQGETMAVIPLVPGGEEEVVRNQQLAASMMLAVCHIQLHRRQAFPEVALFSRKMCGLPKAAIDNVNIPTPQQSISPYSGAPDYSDTNSAYGSQHLGSAHGSSLMNSTMPSISGSAATNAQTNAVTQHGVIPADPTTLPLSQEALNAMNVLNGTLDGLLWDSSIYPASFPTPWFDAPKGAAELYQPLQETPAWLPPLNGYFTAETGYIGAPVEGFGHMGMPQDGAQDIFSAGVQRPSLASTSGVPKSSEQPPAVPPKPHKAWGVDIAQQAVQLKLAKPASSADAEEPLDDDSDAADAVVVGPDGPFPPGMSLARVAQAAHSVIRLEVLHRSATLALWKGPPKWLPFCACGLLSGAYSFLLLSLAVQASSFSETEEAPPSEELEALMTNVKVILAGLDAYGTMWDGIDMMAGEVRAALDAAKKLPEELRNSSQSPPVAM